MSLSCCCSVKKDKNEGGATSSDSNNAPSVQAMNRELNDDERAVDWWRNRIKSPDEDGDDNDNDYQAQPQQQQSHAAKPPRPQGFNAKDASTSTNRFQEPNLLEKPYDMRTDIQTVPRKNTSTQSSNAEELEESALLMMMTTADSIEVFEPEFANNTAFTDPPPAAFNDDERLNVFDGKVTKPKENTAAASTKHKLDASGIYRKTSSSIAQFTATTTQSSEKEKKRSSSSFLKRNKKNKEESNETEDETPLSDHLSDLPSDVDSVTRDRYLLACNMLKATLMEKDKAVVPIEREFILSLLGDYDKAQSDISSVISEDQVSAIEKATLRLDQDPLFKLLPSDKEGSDIPLLDDSPLPAKEAASIQNREARATNNNSKNLQSANNTTKTKKRMAGPSSVKKPLKKMLTDASSYAPSCNHPGLSTSKKKKDKDCGPADIVLLVRDSEDEDDNDSNEELVRFDGWSGHKSDDYPFKILDADDPNIRPRVLTPSIMEALRGFFPYNVAESNFWLKFSMNRDGTSLATLLDTIRASSHTIIAVETQHGEIFGSFTSTPWRAGTKWFGTGEAFLWRLKKSRMTTPKNSKIFDFENKMEVYPYTGYDDLVQYCTSKTIAIGGGDWTGGNAVSPFEDEPKGIGLMIDGDLAGGETNSCATFANPRLCKKTTTSNEFSISNIEVWTLTPCLDSKEASKLEVKKLFVEENAYYEI